MQANSLTLYLFDFDCYVSIVGYVLESLLVLNTFLVLANSGDTIAVELAAVVCVCV